MKEITITCDQCGERIGATSFEYEPYIVLADEPRPFGGGVMYGTSKNDGIGGVFDTGRTVHFCDVGCLAGWWEARRTDEFLLRRVKHCNKLRADRKLTINPDRASPALS